MLCVKFNGSVANSKEEIKRVRERKTGDEEKEKRQTDRKWVNQRRREGREERKREMIDGAKKPISCFI